MRSKPIYSTRSAGSRFSPKLLVRGLSRAGGDLRLLLVVALLVRLGVAILLPLPDDFMYLMEPGRTAANLVTGQGYTFDFYGSRPEAPLQAFLPPLHPWLIALALQFSDSALAYGLFQALLGSLTVWLLVRLATELAGQRVGALTGWGAALYPPHVLLVGQPHSTVLNACCLVAVLLACWWVYRRPGIGQGLLAGGLVGIFALDRPQIVLFIPMIVGWLWLNGLRRQRIWRPVMAMGVATVIVVLPWTLRNTVLFGRLTFISTYGGMTFWNGNNPFTTGSAHDVHADKVAAYRGIERDPSLPDVYAHPEPYPLPPQIEAQVKTMPEPELDRALYRAGLEFIREHPLEWLRLVGQKLVSFWWFRPNLGANPIYRDEWTLLYQIQYPLVLIPAIIGMTLSLGPSLEGSESWRHYVLLYAIMLFYTIVHVAFNVLTRYRWEIELLLLLFAALALERGWQKLRRGQILS